MADYFDYPRVAAEAGLTPEQVSQLEQAIRLEYPRDDMLFELHVLRACRVIRDGLATFEEVARSLPTRKSAA